jgi:three-Cys-motif partner protein
MADEEFWQTAEDWSRRKHLVLDYYLTPAAAKLRQVSPDGRVIVLDGFAGRGEYEDGTPGSPVLIGRLADRAHAWSNPVDLKVFNIEPGVESFRELERCTAAWTEHGVIRNLRGSFREQLPVVLREARQSPLFAFLDPFRPKDLLFEDFAPLLSRTSVTELCIVFHTPGVVRILEAVRPEARTPERTRQGHRTRLTGIFGSSRWESLLTQPSLAPEAVVDCFIDELARGAQGRAYVGSHAIRTRYQVGLKYHIVFFTRNAHGVRLVNDAFCKEARGVYEQTGRREQMSLFADEAAPPVEMDPADRRRILQETLIAIGREAPAQRWKRADLIFASLLRHFGDFSQAEHLQALKELLARSTGPRFRPLDGKPTKSGGWITNDQTTMAFLQ